MRVAGGSRTSRSRLKLSCALEESHRLLKSLIPPNIFIRTDGRSNSSSCFSLYLSPAPIDPHALSSTLIDHHALSSDSHTTKTLNSRPLLLVWSARTCCGIVPGRSVSRKRPSTETRRGQEEKRSGCIHRLPFR